MTKIAVGGTDGLIDRVMIKVGWPASANVADPQRKDALKALNEAEQYVGMSESLLHLVVRDTLTLANAGNSLAVPTTPAIDFGKDITIEMPDGRGTLEYVPHDRFASRGGPVFDQITSNVPQCYTIAADNTGAVKFHFKPPNTSGGNLVYPIWYQRVVAALTDAGTSYSLLPEGYELMLVRLAEAFIKLEESKPGAETLRASAEDEVQRYRNAYRTNKLRATTDTNQESRKVETLKLAEGA